MASDWQTGETRLFGLRHRYALPIVAVLLAAITAGVVALVASGGYVVALAIAGGLLLLGVLFSRSRAHVGMVDFAPTLLTELHFRHRMSAMRSPDPPGKDAPPEPPSPDQLP